MGRISYEKELRDLQRKEGGTLVTIDIDGRNRLLVQCIADEKLVEDLNAAIRSHLARRQAVKADADGAVRC